MKLNSASNSSRNKLSRTNPHPLLLRWFTFALLSSIFVAFLIVAVLGYRAETYGLPYLAPRLYNSQPKNKNLNLSGYTVNVAEPIDNRVNFYGEYFRKGSTIQPVSDYYHGQAVHEIQSKIESDMNHFSATQSSDKSGHQLVIKTAIDVFYPEVRNGPWSGAYAKVRLDVTARLNDSTIIDKKYETYYKSSGLDKDYEGSLVTSPPEGANIVIGVALRKTLDKFYTDLNKALEDRASNIKLKNVLFDMGSADVLEESKGDLDTVITFMKGNPKVAIELDGYTDNLGDLVKDKELSVDRVKTVKSYLVHHGIRARRIKTKALGATRPISTDHNLNRRVEFVIVKNKHA